MASVNTHDSSQLLWIEIHGVTNTLADGEEEDKIKVSIVNSKGDEEMKSETANEKKEGGKDRKKSESKSTQQRMRGLKEKCVAFSDDTIIVSRHTEFFSGVKSFIHRDRSKKPQGHPPPQKEEKEKKFSVCSIFGKANGRQNFEYPLEDMNVVLHVTLKSLGTLSVSSVDDSKLGEEYDKLKDSSLSGGTLTALKDLASKLQKNVDLEVLDAVVEKVKSFAEAHPLIKTAVIALSIPYEMWKQEREFKGNLKALAMDMCTSLESMIEAYPSMDSKHAKETVTKLLKLILQASTYVKSFSKKDEFSEKYPRIGRIKQFVGAQFPKKLDDYRSNLRDCRIDFREATLVDVLMKSGAMKDRGDDMSFLDRKLKHAEPSMAGECLLGTRKTILSSVNAWLTLKLPNNVLAIILHMAFGLSSKRNHDWDKPSNVLWVTGSPGAGKSALATTIVGRLIRDESEYFQDLNCVKFFIKRGAFDDPRVVWRSIAYQLADLSHFNRWYRGVKVDILEFMSERQGLLYPHDASIKEQFDNLICKPLKKLFANCPALSRTIVVVIDALDECSCEGEKGDEYRAFLDTIVKWNKELPAACKLVLTSRVESMIEEKLKKVSCPAVLDTGDCASEESNRDIRLVLKTGFKGKKVEQEQIEALAEYAAGLFIWVRTVIEYVGNGDFSERLKEVLANMSAAAAREGETDKIGMLYGQIIRKVSWSRRAHSDELDRMSLVLASVVPDVLQGPLSLDALAQLWSFQDDHLSDIEHVVGNLKSIITIEDGDRIPCVRHKSISDFLQDDQRVIRIIEDLIPETKTVHSSGFLAAFSHGRQHALLAKGCLQLINNNAAESFTDASISPALLYACVHWTDHLRGAVEKNSGDSNDIHLAPLIETFVEERVLLWLEVLSQTGSAGDGFNSLRDGVAQLPAPSWSDDFVLKALESIANNVDFEALDITVKVFGFFAETKQLSTKIVIEALFIRYQSLKEEHEFIVGAVTPLMIDLCTSLKLLERRRVELNKNQHVDICAIEILLVVEKSSAYMCDLKNEVDMNKLTELRLQIGNCLLNFREAVAVRKLLGVHEMNDGEATESFLRRKLDPYKISHIDKNCLLGTRASILSSVDKWLDGNNMPNVLWISGAPGVGKTAVASSIVRSLPDSGTCKFFMKKQNPRLRDPCVIWPSIAFQLAVICRAVKVDILECISDGLDIKSASVNNQFRQLILEPIKKQSSANLSSWRPILVIDALDECDIGNQEQWHAFFDTIVAWSTELPWKCKLVVTSRPEEEIKTRLKDSCYPLVLNADAEESNADIQKFFEMEFQQKETGWSDPSSIARLTQSAGGVFAWATTTVEFVRKNPVERLEVLCDMVEGKEEARDVVESPAHGWISKLVEFVARILVLAATSAIAYIIRKSNLRFLPDMPDKMHDGKKCWEKNKLDMLYGRILVKVASKLARPEDLNIMSIVLALVSLPRNPISSKAICHLLPPDHISTESDIEVVIKSLSPVICFEEDGYDLYAHHRSFSDFLQDKSRYEIAMNCVFKTSLVDRDQISSALSLTRQCSLFEEGCFRLINACCRRAYPLVIELANINGWHKEPEYFARHFKRILRPDLKISDQLDILFLLTDAWLKFQTIFTSTELEALRVQVLVTMCQYPASVDAGPPFSYKWFILMTLLDPNSSWSSEHRCTDVLGAFAVKLQELLESTDAPRPKYPTTIVSKQPALEFLNNLAAGFKCVDDYVGARFTCSPKIHAFSKYSAFLQIYQCSMRYWELELQDNEPHNLEGSVTLDWSEKSGMGGSSLVFECSALLDDRDVKVAVKIFSEIYESCENASSCEMVEEIAEELRVRCLFDHPNVLKCLGYVRVRNELERHSGSIATVHPWAKRGSIHEMKLGIHEAFAVSLGIAKGMCFLHQIGVLHRDLKSPNVLMSDSGEALVIMPTCTVNVSALGDGEFSGSRRWLPYEYYRSGLEDDNGSHRTQKWDIWAFGMTILELLTKETPYAHCYSDGAAIRAIMKGKLPHKPTIDILDPDADLKHFMWSICLKCWRLVPEERPSMREILEEMLDYPQANHSASGNERPSSGVGYAEGQSLLDVSCLGISYLD